MNLPHKIQVESVSQGWFKNSYSFKANGDVIAELIPQSFGKKAVAKMGDQEFHLRRKHGWLKQYLEITSPSEPHHIQKIQLGWNYKFSVTDRSGNDFHFKPTGWWNRKWLWTDRMNSPIVEITTKYLSKKKRGTVDIRRHEMQDWLYWIIVAWFVVVSSESDAAVVVAT